MDTRHQAVGLDAGHGLGDAESAKTIAVIVWIPQNELSRVVIVRLLVRLVFLFRRSDEDLAVVLWDRPR